MHGLGAIQLHLNLSPTEIACITAKGYYQPATGQCLATPPPTGLAAVPTWAWLLGGAGLTAAAWWFYGKNL